MRIRMRSLLASPEGALEAGKVYDLDEDRARQLVDEGAAAAVDDTAEAAAEPDDGSAGASPQPGPDAGGSDREEQLREWTVMDLRNYASDRKIDLGEATRKVDIIAAILAAERG